MTDLRGLGKGKVRTGTTLQEDILIPKSKNRECRLPQNKNLHQLVASQEE